MSITTLAANGVDSRVVGLRVERVEGWYATPGAAVEHVAVHGRAGGFKVASGSPQGRLLNVSASVRGTTVALRNTYLDQVKDFLSSGILTISRFDDVARVVVGTLEGRIEVPTPGKNLVAKLSFAVRCESAWLSNVQLTLRALVAAATRYTVPLGTAPSAPIIRLRGTNPVLTYRDAGATIRKSMTFTLTMAAGDYLEIDMGLVKIRKSVSGTITNGRSTLTSGDFPWALDPRDGNQLAGVSPTVETSVGTGLVIYQKEWQ